MNIRILSDLHLECYRSTDGCGVGNDIHCDAVVLAGDIHNGLAGIEWAARTFNQPIIYVLGNHEFYGHDVRTFLPRARECAHDLGVHLLEKGEAHIGGVRFLGCTLWTGFEAGPLGPVHATRIAHPSAADFSEIRECGRLVPPSRMIEWHQSSLSWLASELNAESPAVVVTHFAPTRRVLDPRFGVGDELTPYFYNDLEQHMGTAAPLWIYGHSHYSTAKTIETDAGRTRVVSNQFGYPDENTGFDAGFLVTV